MLLNVNNVKSGSGYVLKEEVTLDSSKYPPDFPLQEIKTISCSIKAHKYDDFLALEMHLKADLVLICSYTLKPFDYVLKTSDDINFSFFESDEEDDMVPLKGNIIDLDPFIYRLLMASLPIKPVAPGATPPKSGPGYTVNTDEDEEAEHHSPFDKLLDLDID